MTHRRFVLFGAVGVVALIVVLIVNRDPYGEGWFVTMTPSDGFDPEQLLDAAAYTRLIE